MGKLSNSDKGIPQYSGLEEREVVLSPGTVLRHRVASRHVLIPGREGVPAILLFHQLQEPCAHLQTGPPSSSSGGRGRRGPG